MASACFLCGSQLDVTKMEKCERCGVEACAPHCFKMHQYEDECRPFVCRQNDEVGRFLVATRKISALEVVLIDPPILLAPQSLPVCLVCLSEFFNFYLKKGHISQPPNTNLKNFLAVQQRPQKW